MFKTAQNIDMCYEHRDSWLLEMKSRYSHLNDISEQKYGLRVYPALRFQGGTTWACEREPFSTHLSAVLVSSRTPYEGPYAKHDGNGNGNVTKQKV